MSVAAVVLAAGAGVRYGRPKALVRLPDGELFVERAVRIAVTAGCDPVVVVLGAAAAEVLSVARLGTARPIVNSAWESGLGSSLHTGLTAVTADAAVVLLADMPGVTSVAVRRLTARATPDVLAVAAYAGQQGHPVLLGRNHWAAICAQAVGDTGARGYLSANDVLLQRVEVGDVADGSDVDVPCSV